MAILTIAGLTIKEAIRRRLFIAGLLIALIFVALAFIHIGIQTGPVIGMDMATARDNTGKTYAWVGCGMIKFFASILAVTLAAGAITAEVERGVLSVVVPKPLSRGSIYLGKWLGFVGIMAACMVVWGGLLALAVWIQTHTFHAHIFGGILATFLFPVLFLTLTLAFSSFATYALSAGLALITAGIALAEDTLLVFSRLFNSQTLETLSKIVSYIVPLSRMNHWITKGLGDAGLDWSAFGPRGAGASAVATTTSDMVYIVGYIIVFLVLGLIVFQKRDL